MVSECRGSIGGAIYDGIIGYALSFRYVVGMVLVSEYGLWTYREKKGRQ
jgi:hypothetical protein